MSLYSLLLATYRAISKSEGVEIRDIEDYAVINSDLYTFEQHPVLVCLEKSVPFITHVYILGKNCIVLFHVEIILLTRAGIVTKCCHIFFLVIIK